MDLLHIISVPPAVTGPAVQVTVLPARSVRARTRLG